MDYCGIEWFPLEINRDHSVVFETASKYCILDSFVDCDGYSISYKQEQYCLGTWNVRSMNQVKVEVVKQETARVNVDILGISELKWTGMGEFNSVQFSRSVMSDSLRPHESQHTRPPCPSPSPGVHSDSRPLSP